MPHEKHILSVCPAIEMVKESTSLSCQLPDSCKHRRFASLQHTGATKGKPRHKLLVHFFVYFICWHLVNTSNVDEGVLERAKAKKKKRKREKNI